MKQEELIVGRWYGFYYDNDLNKYYIFKFEKIRNNLVDASEYLFGKNHYTNRKECGICYVKDISTLTLLTDMSFLPPKHPDLNFINTYELW